MKRIASALALVALAGCAFNPLHVSAAKVSQGAAAVVSRVGNVLLVGQLHGARTVQYVSTEISAMKVSILDASTSALVASNVYSGSSLTSHLSGTSFNFQVNNLVVDDSAGTVSYNARVDAYLDAAATTLIGSSTTAAPFTIVSGQTTTISNFPSLALIATPVGNGTATGSSAVTIVNNPPPAVTFN